ncbi:MAG: NADH-ubiquinone oxidoreductase-F iron-sulfur binding region domain-containing protein [Acidobacteriota bacterium]
MSRTASGETLYPRLREIQKQDGFISKQAVESLSHELNVPLYHLQGLVSFYPAFRTEPPRPTTLRICRDLSCRLAGSGELLEHCRRNADGRDEVSVLEAPCLGRCERAVAVEINGVIRAGLTRDSLDACLRGGPVPGDSPFDSFPQKSAQLEPYASAGERFGELRACLETKRSPEEVISSIRDSSLRGMGGAGFPTGVKWQIVRQAEGSPKYVICNADESEPGTFKDRVILERWPHLVLEGMLICMWAVGAKEGWIYIRHEYAEQMHLLEEVLAQARAAGLVGGESGGSDRQFEVRLFESPGGYICGEETALLEAMEGKRAEPRNKPPFPGTHGLWNRPTAINNVETFAFVPAILRRGPEWFSGHGENGGKGLKFLALSGHVNRPGVYEVPLGITARRFIEEYGQGVRGSAIKAFAPGGASSGFLPASELDVPLEFKALADRGSMLGSGAVVVVAEGTDMVDMALNVVRFFRDESCGKCVPCREGTSTAVRFIEAGGAASGQSETDEAIEELSQAMALTSICGLGQVALIPLLSIQRHWPEEWARAMGNKA